tara:strand:+ start:20664 stop:20939 length:276 start_codon:yes stop_codon:yes gene_type:complete
MINIKLKSSSDDFANWIKEVDEILSTTQTTTIDGQPMEYSHDHFQEQMRRLQQCSMNFEMHPIYPINEQIAMDLIYSHIKGKQDNDDKSIL